MSERFGGRAVHFNRVWGFDQVYGGGKEQYDGKSSEGFFVIFISRGDSAAAAAAATLH